MRIALCALIVLLGCVFAWLTNLPQDAGLDVPEGKLNSLSFAPFREGHNPIEGKFPNAAEVDEDMQLMAKITHGIRTYASGEGTMPLVPEMARKYGLTMIQGAWLGYIKKDNAKEIAALISSANANPDVVKRVMVGNEVLLRGEMPPEELIEHIRAVKQAVRQPVSYADVWSMYMKHPQLIKEVDFITIHILPYWEDEPISAEEAPAHIERIYKLVRQEADVIAPGKPILIGETGWPSEGRQRGRAVPSVVNQARVMRGLIHVARNNGFDVNLVEAFHQPWKSILEGVVGANWGLYSSAREQVFPLTGKVYEDQHWIKKLLSFIVLFAGITAFCRRRLKGLPLCGLAVFLTALYGMCVLWSYQVEYLLYTSYNDVQRAQAVAVMVLNAALGGLLLQRTYRMLSGTASRSKGSALAFLLYGMVAGLALYKTWHLAFHGRYLSFPVVDTSLMVFGVVVLGLVGVCKAGSLKALDLNALLGQDRVLAVGQRWVGFALLAMGLVLVWGESNAFIQSRDFIQAHPDLGDRWRVGLDFTLANGQLVTWLCFLVVLALPLVIKGRR